MAELIHSIRIVSLRTGLSAHVIRVWEKRYGAVTPHRSGTNRRLYSDAEIERLSLLREATQAGHSICHVARLPDEAIKQALAQLKRGHVVAQPPCPPEAGPECYLKACLKAVKSLDGFAMEQSLRHANLCLGSQGLLRRVVAPLIHQLGELWQQGEITSAHEHFATGILRVFLGQAAQCFSLAVTAPGLVVATPGGQIHELGAVMAAAAAAAQGWRVTYLGVGLPAAEIAGAAMQNRVRVVAISLVYPVDDPQLGAELESLRRYLPPDIALVAGGRACGSYRSVLSRVGARVTSDIGDFATVLETLRGNA